MAQISMSMMTTVILLVVRLLARVLLMRLVLCVFMRNIHLHEAMICSTVYHTMLARLLILVIHIEGVVRGDL